MRKRRKKKYISNFKVYKEIKRYFIKDEVRISNKCNESLPALFTVGKCTVKPQCAHHKTARLAKEKSFGSTLCSPACGDDEIHPFPGRMQK